MANAVRICYEKNSYGLCNDFTGNYIYMASNYSMINEQLNGRAVERSVEV
jgi:hypothetical protein